MFRYDWLDAICNDLCKKFIEAVAEGYRMEVIVGEWGIRFRDEGNKGRVYRGIYAAEDLTLFHHP